MKALGKFLFYLFLICFFTSCSGINKDEDKNIQEFCELGAPYFENLLGNIVYVLNRSNGYMFDIKEDYRIFVVMRPDSNFYSKEIFPERDTIFYNIDFLQNNYKEKFKVDIDNIKEIINFCEKMKITEIHNRPNQNLMIFKSSSFRVRYTESPPQNDEKVLCENWYLSED